MLSTYGVLAVLCVTYVAIEGSRVDCANAQAAAAEQACAAFGQNSAVCSLAQSQKGTCGGLSSENQLDVEYLGETEELADGKKKGRKKQAKEAKATAAKAKKAAANADAQIGKASAPAPAPGPKRTPAPAAGGSGAQQSPLGVPCNSALAPAIKGSSLPGMFRSKACSNFSLPACSSLAKDGEMKPVKLDDAVRTGATTVKVGNFVNEDKNCEWMTKDSCKLEGSLERAVTWRQSHAYMGVSVLYNCLPQFKKMPEIKSGGKSNVSPERDAWKKFMDKRMNTCANTLTLTSPTVFKAQEVVLKSTYEGLICNSPGSNGFTQPNVMFKDDKGKIYANRQGKYSFDCEKSSKDCTIKLEPALTTSKLTILFRCFGFSGDKSDKTFKFSDKWSTCYGKAKYGFANTAAMGTKLQLDVQIRSAMTDFVWSPQLKANLVKEITSYPQLNCTALLASCHLDAHFTQWKIPNYGEFEQSPAVLSNPIGLTVRGEVWNATVSKKRFIKTGESILEKRMVCINAPKRSKECCVTKQLMEVLKAGASAMKMAQARLENF